MSHYPIRSPFYPVHAMAVVVKIIVYLLGGHNGTHYITRSKKMGASAGNPQPGQFFTPPWPDAGAAKWAAPLQRLRPPRQKAIVDGRVTWLRPIAGASSFGTKNGGWTMLNHQESGKSRFKGGRTDIDGGEPCFISKVVTVNKKWRDDVVLRCRKHERREDLNHSTFRFIHRSWRTEEVWKSKSIVQEHGQIMSNHCCTFG